ncbi:uncharacterized protein LOC143250718 isoform X2 [Tachypleus tridentatus]|uniref:uncharacterized protein LOC143250718 isoform X2 n=1 Tax=Tachypleus tridentatus TaxID=6853 RepID=UPI003FD402D5
MGNTEYLIKDLDKNNLKEFAKCVRREFSIEALEIWDSCRGHILPEEDELTTVRALCKMNETGRKLSSCLRPLLILEGDLLQEIVNGCLP